MTSAKRRPEAMVMNQVRRKRQVEGKKPAVAVSTGRPSIPAPIEVPVTSEMAVTNLESKRRAETAFSMGRI
jgi:hypothetical protein